MTRTIARTARKIHHCADCGGRISPGERYLSHVASPNDPDVGNETWWRMKECARCATRYAPNRALLGAPAPEDAA